jgi:demethylmenaquinone methyltransferase/2-methoxy-6-polyprenyl-1,4-benzoquinol methylase
MSISEDFVKREHLRSHLFGETWRELIPEVFRDVPTYYDKGNAVASLGSCARWSNTFAIAILKHLPRGAKVLDVCSGTHDIPLRLLAFDPTLQIHAVDGSVHMTDEGQRRARERNLTIHARVCDAHVLPFEDNSFDAVTLQFASRHLEIIKAFREIHRVLKPGGIFCHNDMLRPSSRIIEIPYLWYLRFSVWFTAKLFGFARKHEMRRLLRQCDPSLLQAARAVGAARRRRLLRHRKSRFPDRRDVLPHLAQAGTLEHFPAMGTGSP